jgi:hypothetical protein
MKTAQYIGKWNLVQQKIINISASFVLIIILFDKAFKYGYGAKFWGYVAENAETLCRIL